jgi:hypothetical protein
MRGFRFVLAVGLVAMCVATTTMAQTKEATVIVNLHAHRGEIRAALLQHTPLGSNVKDVMNFISKQLQRDGENSPVTVETVKDDSQPRAAKAIRVYLGQYYDHPEVVFLSVPLMMQREVRARWLFDSHDRLIDLVVDKRNGLY